MLANSCSESTDHNWWSKKKDHNPEAVLCGLDHSFLIQKRGSTPSLLPLGNLRFTKEEHHGMSKASNAVLPYCEDRSKGTALYSTVDLQTFIHILPVQKIKETERASWKMYIAGRKVCPLPNKSVNTLWAVKPVRLQISVGYSLNQDYFKTLP